MAERRPVQARLSVEAWEAWDRLLADQRSTFTAIIEAIGLDLAAGRRPLPERILKAAAQIDRQRSSRRKP